MVTIDLIAKTDTDPNDLISHAAKTCYTSKTPQIGKQIDIKNALFKTGHHTTLQHNFFTFSINNISIAAVTFGLHMTHSFYNTDQRSGRYSKMYNEPDFGYIKQYIDQYWNDLNKNLKKEVLDFIKIGTDVYTSSINKGTEIALELLKQEEFTNHQRATMGSIISLMTTLVASVSAISAGVLSDLTNPRFTIIILVLLSSMGIWFYSFALKKKELS
ncbi:FAD-dependent thymidylate synthase [Pseudomonadota bacterium]